MFSFYYADFWFYNLFLISSYIGPSPPKGTGKNFDLWILNNYFIASNFYLGSKGLHRYVVLVFLQQSKLDSTNIPDLSSNRSKFCTKDFMLKNGLQLLAGNFLQCEA